MLAIRIPVDDLAKYAGITALASAVLAVAGILATVAYLSAWNVPAPIVRLDPTTAALRSDTVIFQLATLWGLVIGLAVLWHRLRARATFARIVLGGSTLTLIGLALVSAGSGAMGPAITLGGAVVLFLANERRRFSQRGLAIALVTVGLLAAYQTGIENGVIIRDHATWQTPVTLTVRMPIAGLADAVERGGGYQYTDLYLVFRDGESVYVSRPHAGSAVWIVPTGNLMGLGIDAR